MSYEEQFNNLKQCVSGRENENMRKWDKVCTSLMDDSFVKRIFTAKEFRTTHWKRLLKFLGERTCQDVNNGRNGKTEKTRNRKTRTFDAFKKLVSALIDDKELYSGLLSDTNILSSVISTLFILAKHRSSLTEEFAGKITSEIVEIFHKMLENEVAIPLKSYRIESLWKFCYEYCSKFMMSRDYQNTLRNCSEVMYHVAKKIRFCQLFLVADRCIDNMAVLLTKYMQLKAHNRTAALCDVFYTNLLRIGIELVENLGIARRLTFLQNWELVRLLYEKWIECVLILEQRTTCEEEVRSTWCLLSVYLDKYLSIFHPDSLVRSILPPELASFLIFIANATLDHVKHCADTTEHRYYGNTSWDIKSTSAILMPESVLRLVARVLILSSSCEFANIPITLKPVAVLDFLNYDSGMAYQVVEEYFKRWSHRIPQHVSVNVIEKLLDSSATNKSNTFLMRYLQCLTATANLETLKILNTERIEKLWKFSITLLLAPNVSNEAVQLVTRIINPCFSVLGLSDSTVTETIWNAVSKMNACTRDVAVLLAHLMSTYEFDERHKFRHCDVPHPQWRLRCGALSFVLTMLPSEPFPFDVILQMMCYKPNYVVHTDVAVPNLECSLMHLYKVAMTKTDLKVDEKCLFVVPELLSYFGMQLSSLWNSINLESEDLSDNGLRRLRLWQIAQKINNALSSNQKGLEDVKKALDEMIPGVVETISTTCIWSDQVIESLDVGPNWANIDMKIKNAIVAVAQTNESAVQVACSISPDVQLVLSDFQANWLKKQLLNAPHLLSRCEDKALKIIESCGYFVEAAHLATNFAEYASTKGRRFMIACLSSAADNASQVEPNSYSSQNETEKNLSLKILAHIIMSKFPDDELRMYSEILKHGMPTLVALRSWTWMEQKDIVDVLVLENLPNEICAVVTSRILSFPLMSAIHIRILAWLVAAGSTHQYTALASYQPEIVEIFKFFNGAVALFFLEKQQRITKSDFLPENLWRMLEASLSQLSDHWSQKWSLQATFDIGSADLRILFTGQNRWLKMAFSNNNLKKSMLSCLSSNACMCFIELRCMLHDAQAFSCESLVLRAVLVLLNLELHSFTSSLKHFIIRNCTSLCSLAIRSLTTKQQKNGLQLFADYWYEIYMRLIELDESYAMKHSFVVFDIFIGNDAWTKFIAIPSITAYEKRNFDIDLQKYLSDATTNGIMLSRNFWTWACDEIEKNKFEVPVTAVMIVKLMELWTRYLVLRPSIAPFFAHIRSSVTSSYYATTNTNCSLQTFIAEALTEIFFDPFVVFSESVYKNAYGVLSSNYFRIFLDCGFVEYKNDMESVSAISNHIKSPVDFLISNISNLAGALPKKIATLIVQVAAEIPAFAYLLLPYLFSEAYKKDLCVGNFCKSVNTVLLENASWLTKGDFPLIGCIMSCIRRLDSNVTTLELKSATLLNFAGLAAACLRAKLSDDSYYLCRANLDQLCDSLRPTMFFQETKYEFSSEDVKEAWETFTGTLIEMSDATTLNALPSQTAENLDACISLKSWRQIQKMC